MESRLLNYYKAQQDFYCNKKTKTVIVLIRSMGEYKD